MQVAQGMLWVWGDSSPAAHIHAAATPAHTVPWMDAQARKLHAQASLERATLCRLCLACGRLLRQIMTGVLNS